MTLAITVAMNMFAFPYNHMVPVIADDKLGAGALGLGLLFSAEGAGATLGSLLIAARAKPQHYTRVYLYGSLLFLVAILVFAFAPWYALALGTAVHRRVRDGCVRHPSEHNHHHVDSARSPRQGPGGFGRGDRDRSDRRAAGWDW